MHWVIHFMLLQLSRSIAITLPCYINTHPKPFLEALLYTTNLYVPEGRTNTEAEVSLPFNSWKLSSRSFDQTNLTSLQVN